MSEIDPNAQTVDASSPSDGTVTADDRGVVGARAPATLDIGAAVGRYRIDGVLGRGGMGVVYRGHDPDLDRPVAIKILRRELREARRRLLKEGQAVARLRHPHVITVHDVGVAGEDLFIAMELVDGGTLRHWLERPRSPAEVLEVLVAAGRGLAAAHAAGLVHRDFKPDNVLVGRDGRVVVGDFGLAQDGGDSSGERPTATAALEATLTAGLAGTPAYMAPEQFRGELAGARSDQFAFCVALWEALYGERPFPPSDPTSIESIAKAVERGAAREPKDRRGVPRRVHAALRRGLSRAPDDRFPDMASLLAALAPPRRGRWLLAAAAVVAAATAVAAVALARRPAGDAALARDPSADLAARHAEVAAAWTADARRAYLASAPDAADAADDVRWFDAYAGELDARLAIATAGLAVGPAARSEDTLTCLRGGVDDLRAAVGRAARADWPVLRALSTCGKPAPAIVPSRAPALGQSRLDPSGDQVAMGQPGGALSVTPLSTGVARYLEAGTRPIRWLATGELAATDAAGGLLVIDPVRGTLIRSYQLDGRVLDVAPTMTRAAVWNERGISVCDVPLSGTSILVDSRAPIDETWDLFRFSPSGERLAALVRGDARPELVVVELPEGRTTRTPLRAAAGEIGMASLQWRDEHTLLVSGTVGLNATDGRVFAVRFDPRDGVARAPEVVAHAPLSTMYLLSDLVDGTLLVTSVHSAEAFSMVYDGQVEPMPVNASDSWPRGVDPTDGRVLVDNAATGLAWLSLRDKTLAAVALGAIERRRLRSVVPFRGGVIGALQDDHGDTTSVVSIASDGRVAELSAGTTVALVGLRCGARHCYSARAEQGGIVLGVLGEANLHGEIHVPIEPNDGFADFDVSSDETSFAVTTWHSIRMVRRDGSPPVSQPVLPACDDLQGVRFVPGTLDAIVMCRQPNPEAFLLLLYAGAKPPQLWYRSSGWIRAFVLIDARTALISTVTNEWSLATMHLDRSD